MDSGRFLILESHCESDCAEDVGWKCGIDRTMTFRGCESAGHPKVLPLFVHHSPPKINAQSSASQHKCCL